jgi:hypothetical protein
MIIGTTVVFQQIEYAKDRPIGYETDGLVAVQSGSTEIHNHLEAVKDELARPQIISELAEAGELTILKQCN